MINDNVYLKVGSINKPVGLKGEVKVFSTTTFKNIRYKKGNVLFLFVDNSYKEVTIESYRQKDSKFDILKFNEFNSPEEIEPFYQKDLFVLKDEKVLKKNQYFYDDLINCKVVNQDNIEIGKVVKIEEFPSQITLKIENSEKKFIYIPFIDVFIKSVDIENKTIICNTIEGMI